MKRVRNFAVSILLGWVIVGCDWLLSPQESTVTSVTIFPSEAEVFISNELQFTTTVQGIGDFNPEVTWRVGGHTDYYGSITSYGLYAAPDAVPATGTIVIATSVADITKADTAFVEIVSGISQITITPSRTKLLVGNELQFTAVIHGSDGVGQDIVWHVNGVVGGTEPCGYITIEDKPFGPREGLYRAPTSVPIEPCGNDTAGQVLITAVSAADASKSDSAIVELFAINSVIVSPQIDSMFLREQEQFTATVDGDGNFIADVTWLVNGTRGGSERYGFITESGLYTTPFAAFCYDDGLPEEAVVTAMSADLHEYDSVSFIVLSGITDVGINPVLSEVALGDSIQFKVIISGNPIDSTVRWVVSDCFRNGNSSEGGSEELGTISKTGLYVAPLTLPSTGCGGFTKVTVFVQSIVDPCQNAMGIVYLIE